MLIGLSLAIGSRERAGVCGRARGRGEGRGQFKRAEREGNEGSQFVEPAPRLGPLGASTFGFWLGRGTIAEGRRRGAGEERPGAGVRRTIGRAVAGGREWVRQRPLQDGRATLLSSLEEGTPPAVKKRKSWARSRLMPSASGTGTPLCWGRDIPEARSLRTRGGDLRWRGGRRRMPGGRRAAGCS